MIPKTFASAIGIGLLALIAFASSATPDRSRIAAGRSAAPDTYQRRQRPPLAQNARNGAPQAGGEPLAAFVPACSDPIDKCMDPVKHLGTQNDCACFACGYGTPNQRSVCTRNPADKDALFKRAK